jgi:2-haloacid dehalogenase
LIIGDSLTSDIQGGANAGIETCWFNPNAKKNKGGPTPTYEIQELKELAGLLLDT